MSRIKYRKTNAVVKKVDIKKRIIIFELASGKIVKGPLVDWTGKMDRIPKIGDKVKSAAMWYSDYICPEFSFNGYYEKYEESGKKILLEDLAIVV